MLPRLHKRKNGHNLSSRERHMGSCRPTTYIMIAISRLLRQHQKAHTTEASSCGQWHMCMEQGWLPPARSTRTTHSTGKEYQSICYITTVFSESSSVDKRTIRHLCRRTDGFQHARNEGGYLNSPYAHFSREFHSPDSLFLDRYSLRRLSRRPSSDGIAPVRRKGIMQRGRRQTHRLLSLNNKRHDGKCQSFRACQTCPFIELL